MDDVIEFGDGRQYKVQTADAQPPSTPPISPLPTGSHSEMGSLPVSKEERFADDFDRSWPRSNVPPSVNRDTIPKNPIPAAPSSATHSPQESSRVLFNEHSNRLEPFTSNSAHRPNQGSFMVRRGTSQSENTASSPTDPKHPRDNVPTSQTASKQSHQGAGYDQHNRRGGQFSSGTASTHHQERPRDKDTSRRENVAHTQYGAAGFGSLPNAAVPSAATSSLPGEDARQPPQSPRMPSSPNYRRPRSREPPPSQSASSVRSNSPSHPRTSHIEGAPTTPIDLEEVRKDVMHNAAERAKQRRQQEEEERMRAQERARKKAAELEAKIKEEKAKTNISPEVYLSCWLSRLGLISLLG